MGDLISYFETPSDEQEATPVRPRNIQRKKWLELAEQLEEKRDAAIQASYQNAPEASTDYESEEAQKARTYQIVMLHQAMNGAKDVHRRKRRRVRKGRKQRKLEATMGGEVIISHV